MKTQWIIPFSYIARLESKVPAPLIRPQRTDVTRNTAWDNEKKKKKRSSIRRKTITLPKIEYFPVSHLCVVTPPSCKTWHLLNKIDWIWFVLTSPLLPQPQYSLPLISFLLNVTPDNVISPGRRLPALMAQLSPLKMYQNKKEKKISGRPLSEKQFPCFGELGNEQELKAGRKVGKSPGWKVQLHSFLLPCNHCVHECVCVWERESVRQLIN